MKERELRITLSKINYCKFTNTYHGWFTPKEVLFLLDSGVVPTTLYNLDSTLSNYDSGKSVSMPFYFKDNSEPSLYQKFYMYRKV